MIGIRTALLSLGALLLTFSCSDERSEVMDHAENGMKLTNLGILLTIYYKENGAYPDGLSDLDAIARAEYNTPIESFVFYVDPNSGEKREWQYEKSRPNRCRVSSGQYNKRGTQVSLSLDARDGKIVDKDLGQ